MRSSIFGLTFLAVLIGALPMSAAPKKVNGIIVRFDCGDNCYLTIRTGGGEEITALCAANDCREWNEQASMPEKFVGRRVTVTIGTGQQFDGSGNNMGDFPAFETVAVGKK